jgi:hypothetical protein
MASLYTDLSLKSTTKNVHNRNNSIAADGQLRVITATYTCTAAEATSGDTIIVAELPLGAIVDPRSITVSNDGAGGTLAVTKIGDAVDDDRYSATSINAGTAGIVAVTPIASALINQYAVLEATKVITATITSASAPTAGKKVIFRIPYIIPQ